MLVEPPPEERRDIIMTKKLLGLAAALGITALASWSVPAVADDVLACTGRWCFGQPTLQCICPAYTGSPGKVITCGAFLQGGCSTS